VLHLRVKQLLSARVADVFILGALIGIATSAYSVYALRIATFQSDEEGYMRLARWIASHFPGALWQEGLYLHGTQRLDQAAMAAGFALARGPGAFAFDHVIQCLMFCSTALPVFLLARRSGFGRPLAHFAALLTLVVPWAVVSTTFLSEALAYPVFAWTLFAVWSCACTPAKRYELLAITMLLVALFTRTALFALVPLWPLAVFWQVWRCGLRETPLRSRPRALLARLWRSHRVLLVLSVAGLLAYLLDVLGLLPSEITQKLTGSYGLPHLNPLSELVSRDRYYLSRAAAGTGFVALAFALAWGAGELVRPRDAEGHGLAVVSLLGVVCVLLSLLQAGPDERYLMYMAIPILLGFCAALRRGVGIGVLVGAIVVVLLNDSVTWPPLANIYDFFTFPAAMFYSRVLEMHSNVLPLVHPQADRVIEGAIVLAGLAWVLLSRFERVRTPAKLLTACAVLGLNFVQTAYTFDKYSKGPGAGPSADERSWVDRHVPSGARVAALAISYGASFNYLTIWREAEFWNTSIQATTYFGSPGYAPLPLGIPPLELHIQKRSGLLSATEVGRPRPVPRLMLVPRVSTLTAGLETTSSREDPALLLNLVTVRQPARLDWRLTGTTAEGFMVPGRTARLFAYSGAFKQPGECLSASLSGPPGLTGRWPFTIASRGHTLERGTLSPGKIVTLKEPLAAEAHAEGDGVAAIQIKVKGKTLYATGEEVSARLENVAVVPCSSAR
jgi:hypothetical protein